MNVVVSLSAFRWRKLLAVCSGLCLVIQANLASADFVVGLGIPRFSAPASVTVILDDAAAQPGTIQVSVQVTAVPNIGDIRAVYFHILDESLLVPDGAFLVTGPEVTDSKFLANSVRRLGSYTWINPHGDFDMGIEIGTSGIEEDDIQSTTFVLSHATASLTVEQFEFQDFGVRLSNVGPAGTRRSYLTYSKLTGAFSQSMPEPTVWPVATLLCAIMPTCRRTRDRKIRTERALRHRRLMRLNSVPSFEPSQQWC